MYVCMYVFSLSVHVLYVLLYTMLCMMRIVCSTAWTRFFFIAEHAEKRREVMTVSCIKTARSVSKFNKSPRGDGGYDDAHTHDLRGASIIYPRESLSKLSADYIILLHIHTREMHTTYYQPPAPGSVVFTYYCTHVIDNRFFFCLRRNYVFSGSTITVRRVHL